MNFENLAAVSVVTCDLGKWVATAPAVCVFARVEFMCVLLI